jgi:hypothetical protein
MGAACTSSSRAVIHAPYRDGPIKVMSGSRRGNRCRA